MAHDVVSLVLDFVDAFLGKADFAAGGLAFESQIPRQQLDFSLESLHALDTYLDLLHLNAKSLKGQQYNNTVLAAGCYLGEVIRRHAPVCYDWVNYEDYFPSHPTVATMAPYGVGTSAVLVAENRAMTMPINKVCRYIDEGNSNNTHFYATAEIRDRR